MAWIGAKSANDPGDARRAASGVVRDVVPRRPAGVSARASYADAMAHTFDPANADRLDDVGRYRYCSRDELVGALAPASTDVVADLGSGTGFYTVDVAPRVQTLYGVDVQPEMHAIFEAKGLPGNVELLAAEVADLPLDPDALDRAYSTMTFHEFAGTGALDEVARVLRPGGRLVTVDWSAAGEAEAGPPVGERHDVESASALIADASFSVLSAAERPETFSIVADLPV